MAVILTNQKDHHRFSIRPNCHLPLHAIALGVYPVSRANSVAVAYWSSIRASVQFAVASLAGGQEEDGALAGGFRHRSHLGLIHGQLLSAARNIDRSVPPRDLRRNKAMVRAWLEPHADAARGCVQNIGGLPR